MRALILAGGFATRLRPLTERIPKSLLPIANRPFLEHQLGLLARHGIGEATLLTGYLARDFEGFAQRVGRLGVRLEISTEETPLGTAGAVASAAPDETFLVLNGDVLTDIDITALIALHRDRGSSVTMALSWMEDSGGFGVVPLDDESRVTAFVQNPKGESRPGDWINAGIYVMEPAVLAGVPHGVRTEFEHPPDPVFPALLADGVPFFGLRSEAYWLDIGDRPRFLRANMDVLERKIEVSMDGQLIEREMSLEDGTRILAPALLSHAPVGRGAQLGPGCVLGAGAHVGAGAVVERSVVLEGAQIGPGAVVRDSVVGPGAVVGESEQVVEQIVA